MHRHLFTRWIRFTYYFSPTAPTTKCPTSCCHSALFFKRNFFYISTLPRPSPRPQLRYLRSRRRELYDNRSKYGRGFSWQTPAFNIGFTTCKIHTSCTKRYTTHGTRLDNSSYIAQIIALINRGDNNIYIEHRRISVVNIHRESAIHLKFKLLFFDIRFFVFL